MCIEELRWKIDQIDRQLIETLAKRERLVKQIHGIKKRRNLPLYAAKREREILANTSRMATIQGLSVKTVEQLYRIILRQFARPVNVKSPEPDISENPARHKRKCI